MSSVSIPPGQVDLPSVAVYLDDLKRRVEHLEAVPPRGATEEKYAQLYIDGGQSTTSGAAHPIEWDHINSNDHAMEVFTTSSGPGSGDVNNAPGDKFLNVRQPGIYRTHIVVASDEVGIAYARYVLAQGNCPSITVNEFTIPSQGDYDQDAYANNSLVAVSEVRDWIVGASDVAGSPFFKTIGYTFRQNSGGAVDLVEATLVAVWSPQPTDLDGADLRY